MKLGILALQGCVGPHENHLKKLGIGYQLVTQSMHLESIGGLILPGGESTTMIHLAKHFGIWDKLPALAQKIPFWGICAGSILMATEVENPKQESLGVLDCKVQRNGFGRQLESFQEEITCDGMARNVVFIRAPKFLSWGDSVQVRAKTQKGGCVFLDSGRHIATSFHPELSEDSWLHQLFFERAKL